MAQVVLDTNILVSGFLSPRGAARALLDLARGGSIELIISSVLLDELEDVLTRFVPGGAAREIRTAIEEIAVLVEPRDVPAITRDPDDDHVLAAATAGGALYLVTRDKDLLTLQEYAGVAILGAAAALHTLRPQLGVSEE